MFPNIQYAPWSSSMMNPYTACQNPYTAACQSCGNVSSACCCGMMQQHSTTTQTPFGVNPYSGMNRFSAMNQIPFGVNPYVGMSQIPFGVNPFLGMTQAPFGVSPFLGMNQIPFGVNPFVGANIPFGWNQFSGMNQLIGLEMDPRIQEVKRVAIEGAIVPQLSSFSGIDRLITSPLGISSSMLYPSRFSRKILKKLVKEIRCANVLQMLGGGDYSGRKKMKRRLLKELCTSGYGTRRMLGGMDPLSIC